MTGRLRLYLKWKKALEDGDFDGMRAVSGKELDIIKVCFLSVRLKILCGWFLIGVWLRSVGFWANDGCE